MNLNPFKSDNGPVTRAFHITPSDDHDLEHVTRWCWIGRAGCILITLANDDKPVRLHLTDTGRLDIAAKRIHKSGTTAMRIVGFY